MCYICKYKNYIKNKTNKEKHIINTYIKYIHKKQIPINKTYTAMETYIKNRYNNYSAKYKSQIRTTIREFIDHVTCKEGIILHEQVPTYRYKKGSVTRIR